MLVVAQLTRLFTSQRKDKVDHLLDKKPEQAIMRHLSFTLCFFKDLSGIIRFDYQWSSLTDQKSQTRLSEAELKHAQRSVLQVLHSNSSQNWLPVQLCGDLDYSFAGIGTQVTPRPATIARRQCCIHATNEYAFIVPTSILTHSTGLPVPEPDISRAVFVRGREDCPPVRVPRWASPIGFFKVMQ